MQSDQERTIADINDKLNIFVQLYTDTQNSK